MQSGICAVSSWGQYAREGVYMVTRKLENGALAASPCTCCKIGVPSVFPFHVRLSSLFVTLTRSKMASRWPNMDPRWPRKCPQMAPRGHHDGPRRLQNCRRWFMMASVGPRCLPDAPKHPQAAPRIHSDFFFSFLEGWGMGLEAAGAVVRHAPHSPPLTMVHSAAKI